MKKTLSQGFGGHESCEKWKFPSYISLLHAPLAPPAPPATTITPFIFSSNRGSTGLHCHIYSRLWPIKIIRTASGTRAASIHLFRIFWSFRVPQNSILLVTKVKTKILTKLKTQSLPNKYLTKIEQLDPLTTDQMDSGLVLLVDLTGYMQHFGMTGLSLNWGSLLQSCDVYFTVVYREPCQNGTIFCTKGLDIVFRFV